MRAPRRERLRAILDVRARRPQAIAGAAAQRKRRPALLGDDNQLFIIAADHPGLVVGRTLLFPPDDDVAGAVDAAVGLVRG